MRIHVTLAAVAAGLLVGATASAASAACGDDSWRGATVKPTAATGQGAYLLAADKSLAQIVGMWSVTFSDPNGKMVDFGYQQWHSDGTEILNSGGRSPASENFCMGVWAALHDNEFALNHWALSYDPASGVLNAKVRIRADVHVGPGGNVFSGPFTQDVYNPQGGLIVHLTGQLNGQRITVSQ